MTFKTSQKPPTNYSELFSQFFSYYINFTTRCFFDRVEFLKVNAEKSLIRDRPTIFVANHVSWWDGFFLWNLNRQLLDKQCQYSIMLEIELMKYPFLKRIGAIGINEKNPISVAHAFSFLRKIRNQNSNIRRNFGVNYFPQGQIIPQLSKKLNFRRGIEGLIRVLHPVQIVPVGIVIEPLYARKPTAIIRCGVAVQSDREVVSCRSLENSIQSLLDETINYLC